MRSPMLYVTLAVSCCAISVTHVAPAQARGSENLFTISRSTNANIVRYDAQRADDGQLNLARPMIAYWVMLAENGRREELTWLEREFAYGFSVTSVGAGGFTLRLVAFKQREIRVVCTKSECRARTRIASVPATLRQIYVQTDNGAPMPRVRHVELRGLADDGAAVLERIKAP